jgi:hypothetical protein
VKILVAFCLAAALAQAQSVDPNRITFSGGWSRQLGQLYEPAETATGLGLSYGRRILPFLEPEAGVFAAFNPTPDVVGAYYHIHPETRFIWTTAGLRLVPPLYLGRIEFSAGGGALYEEYSIANPQFGYPSLEPRHGWGGYFVAGAAVSLDHRKHFWLGAAPRWFLANPRYARDRWFMIPLELSFRF